MEYLPPEIWFIILKNISLIDRIKYRIICKQWNELINLIGLTNSERFKYKQMLKYNQYQYAKVQNTYVRYMMTKFSGRPKDNELEEILLNTMKRWHNNSEIIRMIFNKYEKKN